MIRFYVTASSFRMYQEISGKLTQSILAMAVAQLPPPITANFGFKFISISFEKSKILFFYGIGKPLVTGIALIAMESIVKQKAIFSYLKKATNGSSL